MNGFGLVARPSREFAPAGDLLFERPKSRQKVAPDPPGPSLRCGLPCGARTLRPRAKLASLRCAQTVARSQMTKCAARTASRSCAPRRAQRGDEGTATTERRSGLAAGCFGCSAVPALPFGGAEHRRGPGRERSEPRQLTSRPLSERSERSERSELGAAPASEKRRGPLAQRGATEQGRFLCLLSCAHKKVGRPPGRTPGTAFATLVKERAAPQVIGETTP